MIRRWIVLGIALIAAGCSENNPKVEIVTNKGKMKVELFERRAPETVKNFLQYVDAKHYDGLIFHRVIPNFMIQGGGFKPGMEKEVPGNPPIKNESANGLSNLRGTLAMARTPEPHSATSQFFINVVDNDKKLDRGKGGGEWGYCVFGEVIDGMDVANRIRFVKTNTVGPHGDVPVEDVVIESIRRIEK